MSLIARIQAQSALYSNELRSAEENHGEAKIERNKEERTKHKETEEAASTEISGIEGEIDRLEDKGGFFDTLAGAVGQSSKQKTERAVTDLEEQQVGLEQAEEHVAVLEEEQTETFQDIRSANQAVATSAENLSRALENYNRAFELEA